MKKLVLNQFRGIDAFHNEKKLDPQVFTRLENVSTRRGPIETIHSDDDVTANLPIPTLLDDSGGAAVTNDLGEYITSPAVPTSFTNSSIITYVRKVETPTGGLHEGTVLSCGIPLKINAIDPSSSQIYGRLFVATDSGGSPGAALIGGRTYDTGQIDFSEVENEYCVKFFHGVLTTSVLGGSGDPFWIGVSIRAVGTADTIDVYKEPCWEGGSPVYNKSVGAGAFSSTTEVNLLPVWSSSYGSAIDPDEYSFRNVKLKSASRNFSARTQTITYYDQIVDDSPNTTSGLINVPALTPLIFDESDMTNNVGFASGTNPQTGAESSPPSVNALCAFRTPMDDGVSFIPVGSKVTSDDEILIGINQGVVFVTYPYSSHCVPIAFAPRALNRADEISTSKDNLEAVIFSDYLVLNTASNITSQKPVYLPVKSTSTLFKQPVARKFASAQVPDSPKYVTVQSETLVFWGSESQPSFMYWGTRGEIDSFDSFTSLSEGQPITGVKTFKDDTIIFFPNEVHIFSGTPGSAFAFRKIADLGCLYNNQIAVTPNGIYFMSPHLGLIMYNGSFKPLLDYTNTFTQIDQLNRNEKDWVAYDKANNEIHFGFDFLTTYSYVYEIETGNFLTRCSKPIFSIPCHSRRTPTLLVNYADKVYLDRQGTNYRTFVIATGFIDPVPGSETNIFKDVFVCADGTLSTLTYDLQVNCHGQASISTETYSNVDMLDTGDIASPASKVRVNCSAKYMRLTLSCNPTSSVVRIEEIRITVADGGRK